MRIFMTGMTRLQTDTLKVKTIQKIDVPRIIVEQFRKNHGIEWGRTEKKFDCDFLWASIASAESMNSPYSPECFWAIGKAVEEGIPFAVFFDDWQVRIARTQAKKFLKKKEKFFERTIAKVPLFKKVDLDFCTRNIETLLVGADVVANGHQNARLVIPAYAYYNQQVLKETVFKNFVFMKMVALDPSPFMHLIDKSLQTVLPHKRHTLAALMPHKEWVEKDLKPSWPVDYFGSRNLKAPRLKTEADIQQACSKSWGVLSPPYPQSGSGWWRSRYLYASHLKRVLVCDRKDAISPEYQIGPDRLKEIEAMDDNHLKQLAESQSSVFQQAIGDEKLFQDSLKEIIS
jgi:hypothetical protein